MLENNNNQISDEDKERVNRINDYIRKGAPNNINVVDKACLALQACRDMQDLFISHGVEGRYNLLFDDTKE